MSFLVSPGRIFILYLTKEWGWPSGKIVVLPDLFPTVGCSPMGRFAVKDRCQPEEVVDLTDSLFRNSSSFPKFLVVKKLQN